MALTLPPACDTTEKRLRFCSRVQRKLEDWHRAERRKLPDELTRRQVETFKWWERTEFHPRLSRLAIVQAGLRDEALKTMVGTMDERGDELCRLQSEWANDAEFNGAIDVENL